MRRALALTLMLFVASILPGCTDSAPTLQPIEVRVPVPVPCRVLMPERPVFAVDALPIGSGLWEQMIALRAERLQRQGFETALEAAVKACQ